MPDLSALLSPSGDPLILSDEALNDSDKSFYVPLTHIYEIEWIWIEYAATSTGGNREITVELLDANSDTIGRVVAAAYLIADATEEFMFAPGLTQYNGGDSTKHHAPLPRMQLPPRTTIRVWDSAAIAAAADDMIVQIMVTRRYVTPVAKVITLLQPPRAAMLRIAGQLPVDVSFTQRTPAKADLTITAYAPLVGRYPTAAALTITTSAPARIVGVGRAPGNASLTLTGYAASVQINVVVTQSPSLLTIATSAPVYQVNHQQLPAKSTDLSITGQTPIAINGAERFPAKSTDLTITGRTPTVGVTP